MNIIERVKNILIAPAKEWEVISNEQTSVSTMITSYLLPLSLISIVANFIGYGFIGGGLLGSSIVMGIVQAIAAAIGIFVNAFLIALIINALATSFKSTPNFDRAFQLVVYSLTPGYLAAVFNIYPPISLIGALIGLYGLYILYLGIKPMMKTADDQVTTYFVVSLLCMILVSIIIGFLISFILIASIVAAFV